MGFLGILSLFMFANNKKALPFLLNNNVTFIKKWQQSLNEMGSGELGKFTKNTF